ncbi:SPRY domain-containing protein [Limnobacter sp.]|uniref:DUF7483 domain-containing protein n=1 Tax=Limnobacter sp. TaxID=2003368 RepID=UPI0025BBBBD4|nr:SPRY domain-containing protein [Limnobacter sp.]
MSIPGSASPLFFGAGAGEDAAFQIDRSLRFTSGDSAFLSRTPSSAGNRKTWTWSGWVKRCALPSNHTALFTAGTTVSDSGFFRITMHANGHINVATGSTNILYSGGKLRDFSAWYHILVSVDTTASSNQVKCFLNGALYDQATAIANVDTAINSTVAHQIGRDTSETTHADIYLAEVHFLDGTAVSDASDFGEYDDNNVWQPKRYTGTHGTNGFYLKFDDNSSNAALGNDSSGNDNDWTVNNITAKAPGDYDAPKNFGVVTWTGDGSSSRAIKLGFQPDFLWIKRRDTSYHHYLWDVVRGITKEIHTDLDYAEGTATNKLASLDSDGFTVKNQNGVNGNTYTYVAWAWKAGGTASSNTDGTITSSVSANPSHGFSVVSYTGNSTAGATVGHGLSSAPQMIWIKNRDRAINWVVGNEPAGSFQTGRLYVNTNGSQGTDEDFFNDTSPTSSVFSVKNNYEVNYSGENYIAYCWHDVTGYQKLGMITGSGSDQTITTGFCPQYVFFKATNAAEAWLCIDRTRDPSKTSAATKFLEFNNGNAEASNVNRIEWLDDGFKIVADGTRIPNVSGTTYLYLAIAGVPSGEEDDSLIDTPTNYSVDSGNPGGNYAVLNPLDQAGSSSVSNGNLDMGNSQSSAKWGNVRATIGAESGKYYAEYTCTSSSGGFRQNVGVVSLSVSNSGSSSDNVALNNLSDSAAYFNDGKKSLNGTTTSYGASWTTGDVIGIALDVDNTTVTFYKNGVSQGSASTALASNAPLTFAGGMISSNEKGSWNFGQRQFVFDVPTGYSSLVTTNLSDPAIADGSTAMDTALWTGNGTSQTITGLNFSPDFLWVKGRTEATSNYLTDTVRGITKYVITEQTAAEGTNTNRITAVTSDGFSVGTHTSFNENNKAYVGWTWDAADSNTTVAKDANGSGLPGAECVYRANTTAGFSVVKVADPQSNEARVHGLSKKPDLIICKSTASSDSWHTYHSSLGYTKYINLNSTGAASSSNQFGSQEPTSTYFYVKSNTGSGANKSGGMIYFIWHAVEGYSAFGSYEGNGSSDGPFIYTGFKVAWLLIKNADTSGETWTIHDSTRDVDNPAEHRLLPNSNGQESTGTSARFKDLLSNGFKIRGTSGEQNTSGETYIYAAFAEHPLRHARAR